LIKIVTDSTAYLPKNIIETYDIKVLALSVSFGSDIYKETEISHEFFYEELDRNNNFPKSSQPSLEESLNLYESLLKEGHDIISVFISSDMSGTYQTAKVMLDDLRDDYPDRKIEVIDSRSNCMQMGLAIEKGAELLNTSFDQVVVKINHVINHSRFVFIPDTLEYLKKGGRIGSAKALLSSMLQIKPILTVVDGKTTVLNKVRTRKKAMNALIDQYHLDGKANTITGTYVHHIHCEEDAKNLASKIGEFQLVPIGPVIGTHVGPGAIGIAYCWE
jgi:DegV family protein with EDD domain